MLGEFTRSASPLAHAMFLEARRYLPGGAELTASAAATAAKLKRNMKGYAVGRGLFVLYETPDTTWRALLGTTLNLLNATTGPGLLALPLAFARCGWLLGTVLLLVAFLFNNGALLYLLKACLAAREHSYIGLSQKYAADGIIGTDRKPWSSGALVAWEARLEARLAAIVDWCSLLFFFGSCVSYLVIIGDSFSLASSRFGTSALYDGGDEMHFSILSLLLLALFTASVLLPLSLMRSLDSLQCTSAIATCCILYTVALVVFMPSELDHLAPQQPQPPVEAVRLSSDCLIALATMSFCFASQPLFPPALETLHQPATYVYMHQVVSLTMWTTLALHLLVGLAGYLRYSQGTAANILDNLPQVASVGTARLAIVFAFAFTYPMMIFLCRMHLASIRARTAPASRPHADAKPLLISPDAPQASPGPAERISLADEHVPVTLGLVGSSLVLAIIFPNIDTLFGLLGCTCAVVLSLVVPVLFWERFVGFMYPWHHPNKLCMHATLAFAALVLCCAGPRLIFDLLFADEKSGAELIALNPSPASPFDVKLAPEGAPSASRDTSAGAAISLGSKFHMMQTRRNRLIKSHKHGGGGRAGGSGTTPSAADGQPALKREPKAGVAKDGGRTAAGASKSGSSKLSLGTSKEHSTDTSKEHSTGTSKEHSIGSKSAQGKTSQQAGSEKQEGARLRLATPATNSSVHIERRLASHALQASDGTPLLNATAQGGGLVGAALLVLLCVLWRRRRTHASAIGK